MRYLILDIECADGRRAICEFGYVLCDENFNIIQQRNILINPECEFNLTGRKNEKDLTLSYSPEEYYKHPKFDDFYENIKFLMTQKDIMIFGHSVSNDIRFLIKDCNRYRLEKFDFIAYDIQSMLPVFSKQNKEYTSLDKAFDDIATPELKSELIDHRALHDAIKTMYVFKSMITDLEFSINDLIESCPKCKISALECWEKYQDNKKEKYIKRGNAKKREEGNSIWNGLCEKHKSLQEDANFVGRIVTISGAIKEHHNDLTKLMTIIESKNFVAYDKIDGSDYVVTFDDQDKNALQNGLKRPYNGTIITINDFIQMCEN